MRKVLISAILLGTLASAAPAAAQQGRGYGRNDAGIDRQIDQIEDQVRRAAQQRRISAREAQRLLRQADQIDRLEDRYSRNGLTAAEVRDLRNRVQNLRGQLRFERQDGNGRRG